jgi:hypothetical protein
MEPWKAPRVAMVESCSQECERSGEGLVREMRASFSARRAPISRTGPGSMAVRIVSAKRKRGQRRNSERRRRSSPCQDPITAESTRQKTVAETVEMIEKCRTFRPKSYKDHAQAPAISSSDILDRPVSRPKLPTSVPLCLARFVAIPRKSHRRLPLG